MKQGFVGLFLVSVITLVSCTTGRHPAQAVRHEFAEMRAGSTMTVVGTTATFVNDTSKEKTVTKECHMTNGSTDFDCTMWVLVPPFKVFSVSEADTLIVKEDPGTNSIVKFVSRSGRTVALACQSTVRATKKVTSYVPDAANMNTCFDHLDDNPKYNIDFKFTNPELQIEPIKYEAPAGDSQPVQI